MNNKNHPWNPGWFLFDRQAKNKVIFKYNLPDINPQRNSIMKKFFLILVLVIFSMGMIGQTVDSVEITRDLLKKVEQKAVYPNPFMDKLNIKYDQTAYGEIELTATIRNLFNNQLMYEGKFKNEITLQVDDWGKGFYVVLIEHYRGSEKHLVCKN